MPKIKVLVVEDEREISELLQYNLEKEDYQVIQAYDGQTAIRKAEHDNPQLVLLDLMIPEIDGTEVCRYLKGNEKTKHIPIIMLTAKSEESDVIVGLKMGADDYVTKPFSPKILVERVKAVLRRAAEKPGAGKIRTLGGLTIDTVKHKVTYLNKEILLTAIEFSILEFLSRSPGRVYSRDQIMDGAWKEGKFIVDRAVDVHILALRKKLGKATHLIETVRGIGYRFKDLNPSDE